LGVAAALREIARRIICAINPLADPTPHDVHG
jgi:hypothetical protein